jgi:hypothetical protein
MFTISSRVEAYKENPTKCPQHSGIFSGPQYRKILRNGPTPSQSCSYFSGPQSSTLQRGLNPGEGRACTRRQPDPSWLFKASCLSWDNEILGCKEFQNQHCGKVMLVTLITVFITKWQRLILSLLPDCTERIFDDKKGCWQVAQYH